MFNEVSAVYIVINFLLATGVYIRSRTSLITRFYVFCVVCLDGMGILGHYLWQIQEPLLRFSAHTALLFFFSLFPFFFVHFIVLFVRRSDILRSRRTVAAIYFAGLFSYAMILLGLIPEPLTSSYLVAPSGGLFYVTWQSILFCIGVAMSCEQLRGFYGRVEKANAIFAGFAVLMLVLPGPFTQSIILGVFHLNVDWYFFTCMFSLMFGVYFIFRHKIVVNTIYDALKSALAVLNDVFIITDAEFRIQMARGALMPLLHYSERELLGKSFAELLLEQDYLDAYRAYALSGKMRESHFDADVRVKDGDAVPMNFSFTPVFTNDVITGFVSVGRSISDLRRSEAQLHLFRHAVECTPECVYITNLDGKLQYVNKAFEEKFHAKGSDVLGKATDILWEEKAHGTCPGEAVARTFDDTHRFPVRVMTSPIYDDRGDVVGVVNAAEDISEKKAAETALRASEAKFRSLFENIPIGVFQVSPEGKFIAANTVLARMLRCENVDQEFLANVDRRLFPKTRDREAWKQSLSEEGRHNGVEIRVDTGEEVLTLLQNLHAVRGPGGAVEYYEGTLNDITDRKNLENDLRQAQKMESIGTLAGGISHDFNNILQIILLNVRSLRDELKDLKGIEERFEPIARSVHRGAALVRQLMTFAKKTEVLAVPVDLNAAIEEAGRMLSQTLPETIELTMTLEKPLPRILADPTQVHQVFLNLCVNARDAMPEGGTLGITTALVDAVAAKERGASVSGVEYVCVRVQDTGNGMDEQTRSRIFEPFFTTKGIGQGTGLGLAVVHGVVESHRGFIKVESAPGKGTTFCIYLPAQSSVAEVSANTVAAPAVVHGKGETILFVEDETDVREFIGQVIESAGYRLFKAADGLEAVEQFSQYAPRIDLVILDIGLPKLNGWEVYERITEIRPSIKVLLCTGYMDPLQKRTEKERVNMEVIGKPYEPDELLSLIRKVLDSTSRGSFA